MYKCIVPLHITAANFAGLFFKYKLSKGVLAQSRYSKAPRHPIAAQLHPSPINGTFALLSTAFKQLMAKLTVTGSVLECVYKS